MRHLKYLFCTILILLGLLFQVGWRASFCVAAILILTQDNLWGSSPIFYGILAAGMWLFIHGLFQLKPWIDNTLLEMEALTRP